MMKAPAVLFALLSLAAGCSDPKAETKRAAATDAKRASLPMKPVDPALLANMQKDGPRAPDGVRYRAPARYRGELVLSFEQSDFFPDAAKQPGRPVNLVAADPRTDACLGRIGGEKLGERRLRISFIGRRSVEDEGSFGHMGMRSSQVRLERFVSGNPC